MNEDKIIVLANELYKACMEKERCLECPLYKETTNN